MQNKELTPKESFEVINEVISGAKVRLNENGFIYLFWGWLIAICALAQFVLFQTEYAHMNYYPYLLVIPGAIYTAVHQSRKHRAEATPNYTANIMAALWVTAGINMMIAGFLFGNELKTSPIPIILIVLAVATIASGATIKFKPLIWGGIFCNLAGIASVFLPTGFHPLALIVAIIAADLVPGYILRNKFKKSHA